MKFELDTYNRDVPSEDFLEDLLMVAKKLNRNSVSVSEYNRLGKYHADTLSNRFGSWNKAIEKAGLQKTMVFNRSDEALFKNIENVWVALGRQPKAAEMKKPISECSINPYLNRFGSWRNALEEFIKFINQDSPEQDEKGDFQEGEISDSREPKPKRTSKHISHRLRFRILLRDGFTCKSCGKSPLKTLGVELHVDHIIPWSKGGETVPENLSTKCSECNLGKGAEFNQ